MVLLVAAVAVGVATPLLHRVHDVLPASRPAHGTKASFGSLTLVLPGDWRVEAGADVDVCTAPPRTIVTGWLHKHRNCTLPDSVVLVAFEPLIVGDLAAAQHHTRRDDGRTLIWQQTWIHGNLRDTRIDGFLVTVPDGRQVFVVGSSTRIRDAVLSSLSW